MILDDRPGATRRPFAWIVWAGLALAAGISGCGTNDAAPVVKVFPVTGSVILPDGKPLTTGRVVFISKEGLMSPSGEIGADGTFTLSTGNSGEGAPPGEYRVKLEPTQMKKVSKTAPPGAALPFPGKYSDEETSGLTATVKAEPTKLEPFKLDNTPSAAAGRPAGARSRLRD